MSTISIAIATFNEELHISRCLKSINNLADEIIIVDGSSTDNTVILAGKFPKVKVISTTNKPLFHLNKQIAIDACKSDWILQLDADEVVTSELNNEIKTIISQNIENISASGFWIKRKNYFLGKFLTKGGAYPDPTIRFYKRGYGKLPCKSVHEQAQINGTVGWLKNDLNHFADYSFSRYLQRNNRYSTLIAEEYKKQKIPINLFTFIKYFLFVPFRRFLQIYLRHRGYIDGFPGFVFAFYSALTYPIAFTKYFELSSTKTDIDLTKDWN